MSSNLQKNMMKNRLPPPAPGKLPRIDGRGFQKDYNPVMWSEYFADQEDIQVDEKTTFRVYKSKPPVEGKTGPIVFLLHGGGFSALSWSLFSVELTSIIHCQCVAVDLRGHGDSTTEDDENLSAETLATDVGKMFTKLYPENPPSCLLVGHSMGGAIAVHVSNLRLIESLVGVCVIDVVEGTAMDALASMQSFLRSRPKHFKSIQQAIEWSVRSGQIRNLDSARVSMPGQIMNLVTNKVSTNELPISKETPDDTTTDLRPSFSTQNSISEEEEDTESPQPPSPTGPSPPPPAAKNYTWRIDLSKSEKFWPGWFEGLSEMFLNLPVPKLLLLASIDGLDRVLTVGQMQGKFQMQVLARCGHAVHEDRPHEVAEVIGSFMLRNEFAEAANDFVRIMPAC